MDRTVKIDVFLRRKYKPPKDSNSNSLAHATDYTRVSNI
jgi:hypothetical protein